MWPRWLCPSVLFLACVSLPGGCARRGLRLLSTWILAGSFVLGMATPSRADDVRPREVRVCVRPPGETLDRWVFSPGGKVLTERWALQIYGPRNVTVYVFDPSAPARSAKYFPPKLFNSLKCPPKVAPRKLEPKLPGKKSEAGPRKNKTKKEAEEPRAAKPESMERKAEERAAKERKAEELAAKERQAKRERERREEQAQEEERRRWRERERPKVLPRHGVTAAWPSKVLPDQKTAGVTATWSAKVLPGTSVLPRSGTPLCKAPAPTIAGGKESAATMAVREPILKALLGYKKAKSEAEKEVQRRKLRELFESIGTSAAQPFEIMLSTQNALAVMFRDALRGDPFQNELLGILTKKYAPIAAQCIPAAPPPAPPLGETLPAVTLTDEEAFNELHAEIEQQIAAIRSVGNMLTRDQLMSVKAYLLERLLPVLEFHLTRAQRVKVIAFQQADAASKAAVVKKAGAAYAGVLLVSQLWQLAANIAVVTAWANETGVDAGTLAERDEGSPLFKLLLGFRNDNAIIALTQAAFDADVPGMLSALPAGRKAYELHLAGLDRWSTSIGRGAVLSQKVIQVANITMIAISIYQVAKAPVVSGGSPTPPTILGTLPGGVAVGSTVSLASLARAVEAIRRLVAIGALDGALIGGIGSLGGGPSIAMPELQRPTSLSVQSGQGTGGGSGGAGPSKPAADYAGVSGRVKTLPPGKNPNVYQVKTPEEMTNLFTELSKGGRNVTPPTYKGTMIELPDGTLVGMRTASTSGGPTIDVFPPEGSALKAIKVHLP